MQQLALQTSPSNEFARLTPLQRDARDPNHANGGGSFAALFDSSLFGNSSSASATANAASNAAAPEATGLATDFYPNAVNLTSANVSADDSILDSIFGGSTSIGSIAEPALSIAGGALTGGPIGAIAAVAGEVFEAFSGDSVLGHIASLFETAAPAVTANALTNANRAYLSADGLSATPR